MKTSAKKRKPQLVLGKDGEPAAVLLDIKEYQAMLERLEDLDDLRALKEMRRKPLHFRRFEDFLDEFRGGV